MAEMFSLARPSIGAYEEGRAEPKIETLVQISKKFNLSIDGIINKELTVNDLMSFSTINEKLEQTHSKLWTKDTKGHPVPERTGISLVTIDKYTDYQVNFKNHDRLDRFKKIDLPITFKGQSLAFEMNGSEMEYNQQGLHHGDILLCQKANKNIIQTGKVYTVLTKSKIFTRRLYEVNDEIIRFQSDDPNYTVLEDKIEDIIELWEVKGVFSTYLEPPKMIEERVMLLEKRMAELEKKL